MTCSCFSSHWPAYPGGWGRPCSLLCSSVYHKAWHNVQAFYIFVISLTKRTSAHHFASSSASLLFSASPGLAHLPNLANDPLAPNPFGLNPCDDFREARTCVLVVRFPHRFGQVHAHLHSQHWQVRGSCALGWWKKHRLWGQLDPLRSLPLPLISWVAWKDHITMRKVLFLSRPYTSIQVWVLW